MKCAKWLSASLLPSIYRQLVAHVCMFFHRFTPYPNSRTVFTNLRDSLIWLWRVFVDPCLFFLYNAYGLHHQCVCTRWVAHVITPFYKLGSEGLFRHYLSGLIKRIGQCDFTPHRLWRRSAARIKGKDNRYILTLMKTSGYKGWYFGKLGFSPLSPSCVLKQKWHVSRKFVFFWTFWENWLLVFRTYRLKITNS